MQYTAEAEFCRLAEAILERLRRIPTGQLSGDDSPLTDFWLEYAAQVQGEHSFVFNEHERLVRGECDACAESLSASEVQMLWLETSAYWDGTYEGSPCLSEQRELLSDELLRRVQKRAADLDLPV